MELLTGFFSLFKVLYFYQTYKLHGKHFLSGKNYIVVFDMSLINESLYKVDFYIGAMGKLRNLRNVTVISIISGVIVSGLV